MSDLFEEEKKESALPVTVQTENNDDDYSEYYDEDYDESYDDEILEEAYLKIKDRKIDFFFNDAGIYHQKIKYIDGKEITNLVNFIRPIQLITKLSRLENFKETRFINLTKGEKPYKVGSKGSH